MNNHGGLMVVTNQSNSSWKLLQFFGGDYFVLIFAQEYPLSFREEIL